VGNPLLFFKVGSCYSTWYTTWYYNKDKPNGAQGVRAVAACKENLLRKVSYNAFPLRSHVLPEIKEEKERCNSDRRDVCKQRCRKGWGGQGKQRCRTGWGGQGNSLDMFSLSKPTPAFSFEKFVFLDL
jgi:hypothetical protein